MSETVQFVSADYVPEAVYSVVYLDKVIPALFRDGQWIAFDNTLVPEGEVIEPSAWRYYGSTLTFKLKPAPEPFADFLATMDPDEVLPVQPAEPDDSELC